MTKAERQLVRLAKLKIEHFQLENFQTALKEQMSTAVQLEPGVLAYYAVADQTDPTSITILEIYADTASYHAHLVSPHFLKYKETVNSMVVSLELADVTLIGSAKKPGR